MQSCSGNFQFHFDIANIAKHRLLSTQSIMAMQYTIAMDHRRQCHHKYLPRTIDLVIVELLGLIILVTILELVVSISLES